MAIKKLDYGQNHPDISGSHHVHSHESKDGHQRIQQPLTTYSLMQADAMTREDLAKIYNWMTSLDVTIYKYKNCLYGETSYMQQDIPVYIEHYLAPVHQPPVKRSRWESSSYVEIYTSGISYNSTARCHVSVTRDAKASITSKASALPTPSIPLQTGWGVRAQIVSSRRKTLALSQSTRPGVSGEPEAYKPTGPIHVYAYTKEEQALDRTFEKLVASTISLLNMRSVQGQPTPYMGRLQLTGILHHQVGGKYFPGSFYYKPLRWRKLHAANDGA
ncbi:hypothetical protein COCC4DRAFT_61383 [Bipolaris maydis ATCC 48331]|uniref:Uncharacterized protein n=2 Tax=Cochliobolus heterostrophus TaxID=5016 RepID=M2UYP5_COCH5|nr:uncharacterized protein COCC4DRAFT_61383 [Bipolaris maydis ATCC 48331]EMD92842.1 hypothetical protein COCHEDRAFT_1029099 [Bipolaris maydis C5]ENI04769.1 hypothetical protein COCC4DRAFT_61383 [Bipolaris maydis ATCC 48331]KAJ6208306.1 hypothetical protein PSV09DRAFT_1029099 [Bipolaris maydis]